MMDDDGQYTAEVELDAAGNWYFQVFRNRSYIKSGHFRFYVVGWLWMHRVTRRERIYHERQKQRIAFGKRGFKL